MALRAIPLFGKLFVIMDPGRDQDDEDVLVALNLFIRTNMLNVCGVIANLRPSSKRAALAKGTLTMLGQPDVPVGIGLPTEQDDDDGLSYQFAVSYLAETKDLHNGKEMILKTLEEASPKSVVLLLISMLTDAAAVLREHEELFTRKVKRVVIMGGVQTKDGRPEVDAKGRIIPDMSAQNHAFDKESAGFFYERVQDIGIPMTVLSRHAADAAKLPRAVYDDMAATGHPIGIRLRDAQKDAIEELWKRACLPAEDPARHKLPARCDKAWFCTAFCGGQGMDRKGSDSIWDLVQSFLLYDPCTLVAAIPNWREVFFEPIVVEGPHGVEHLVIGLSKDDHNVRDGKALSQFLHTSLVDSLKQVHAVKVA